MVDRWGYHSPAIEWAKLLQAHPLFGVAAGAASTLTDKVWPSVVAVLLGLAVTLVLVGTAERRPI